MTSILTLDIEDWCQSSSDVLPPAKALPRPIPPTERVLETTRRLLHLLAEHGARATCFVLGTVAEAYPRLVREMRDAGHEIATHGYGHEPVYRLDHKSFTADLKRSISALEDATGEKILGYRAPYFSITKSARWALYVLGDLGLTYDSSTYPIHSAFYGYPGWDGGPPERRPHRMQLRGGRSLIELPCSTVRWAGRNLPIGGGGALRIAPYHLIRWAMGRLHAEGQPAIFYLHPFDLDADELRGRRPGEPWKNRVLRRMLNFNRAGNEAKLGRLLDDFRFIPIRDWLQEAGKPLLADGNVRAASAG